MSNSTFHFSDRLLTGELPLNGYSLFDLSNLTQSILLNEKIITLPGRGSRNDTFKTLKDAGIAEELDVDSRKNEMDTILSRSRHANLYEEVPLDGIAKVLCDIFPVSYENAYEIIEKSRDWGDEHWNTPHWDAAQWLLNRIQDEDQYVGSKKLEQDLITRFWQRLGDEKMFIEDTISEIYLRALIYVGVASQFGFNYAPDSIRVPIVGYIDKSLKQRMNQISMLLVKEIEDKHRENAKTSNKRIGRWFDIQIPAIFNMAIKSCSRKQDFLHQAISLREESENIRNLRTWLTEVNKTILWDNDSDKFDRLMTQYEDASTMKRGGTEFVKILIKAVLVPNISLTDFSTENIDPLKASASFSINIPAAIDLTKRYFQTRRLVLLNDLNKNLNSITMINNDLNRVFGESLSSSHLQMFSRLRAYQENYLTELTNE
jgi:hypothetical protein